MHTSLQSYVTERAQKYDFSVNFHSFSIKMVEIDPTFCVRKLTLNVIVFFHLR